MSFELSAIGGVFYTNFSSTTIDTNFYGTSDSNFTNLGTMNISPRSVRNLIEEL